jgi:hypothetical protein
VIVGVTDGMGVAVGVDGNAVLVRIVVAVKTRVGNSVTGAVVQDRRRKNKKKLSFDFIETSRHYKKG